MRSVALTLSIALVVAACSSSKDSPTQPPPVTNRVASLTRVDTSVLQFTGKKVAIRKLFIAKDANGVVIPNATISCATPAGFTFTGDSLIAPASELRGRLRCSATTLPATASASLTSSPAGGPQRADSGLPSDSLAITAGIDLRLFTWRVAFTCTGGTTDWPQLSYTDSAGVYHYVRADSIVAVGQVDSIAYSGTAATFANYGTVGQVLFHTARTFYATDGRVVHDTSGLERFMYITQQSPDTLFMGNVITVQYRQPMVRVGTTGRRYEGTGWCRSDRSDPTGPAVFEAVTP